MRRYPPPGRYGRSRCRPVGWVGDGGAALALEGEGERGADGRAVVSDESTPSFPGSRGRHSTVKMVEISSALSAVLRCENFSCSEAVDAERCGYGDLQ
jgi:hypothetical protein